MNALWKGMNPLPLMLSPIGRYLNKMSPIICHNGSERTEMVIEHLDRNHFHELTRKDLFLLPTLMVGQELVCTLLQLCNADNVKDSVIQRASIYLHVHAYAFACI